MKDGKRKKNEGKIKHKDEKRKKEGNKEKIYMRVKRRKNKNSMNWLHRLIKNGT